MGKSVFDVRPRVGIGIAMLAAVWLTLNARPAGAAVADPTVTGPIPSSATPGDPSHDYIFFASQLDLAGAGYVEEEYFLSGTANRYFIAGTATGLFRDGNHAYRTRIVVRRPASADQFNGIAIVEWLNVTNNFDMENTWFQIDEHLLRSGYAWVGVSAQRVGVNFLRTWSPSRYGTLDVGQRNASGDETIIDDALSYDIFSQAEQAVRAPVGIDPLGGLHPQLVIATGHSQSARNLSTYVNAIQPLSHAFDAFALHGSLGNAIREDLEVPVWKVLSEFDVSGFGEAEVRRPDDALFSTWEVAGTSHNDRRSYASRVPLERRDVGVPVEDSLSCGVMPPGSAIPFHHVMAAGLEHLVRWVRDGTPMPSAPPIETVSIAPTVIARDPSGNALGGIRLSEMDVPTAVNSGTNTGPGLCDRWGYTLDFDPQTLAMLYPTHTGYVSNVSHVDDRNLVDGFLLPPDAQQTLEEAEQAFIGVREQCEDGIDNDGDGKIDFDGGASANHGVALGPPDPGCPSPWATFENPMCDDGIDNDGNGLVDFADPKCSPEWPYWEKTPGLACGLGAELALIAPVIARAHRSRKLGAKR